MTWATRTALCVVLLALSACSGESPLERCVEHAVEEGGDRAQAREECERVVGDR